MPSDKTNTPTQLRLARSHERNEYDFPVEATSKKQDHAVGSKVRVIQIKYTYCRCCHIKRPSTAERPYAASLSSS